MVDTLPFLINKQDGFEVVRDQTAVIINENQAAQVVLAAGEPDPNDWKLRVYIERANPWEAFLNDNDAATPDQSPIVNVWYESGTFPESSGNVIARQDHRATINVDVYAWGIAKSDPDNPTGHIPGDLEAAEIAQRGTRLVRNILMASQNAWLQLRADVRPDVAVGQRWIQSITSFQPEIQNEAAHAILGIRLALNVRFSEFAQQADESNLLEFVSVDVLRDSDGMLIAEADFDYT